MSIFEAWSNRSNMGTPSIGGSFPERSFPASPSGGRGAAGGGGHRGGGGMFGAQDQSEPMRGGHQQAHSAMSRTGTVPMSSIVDESAVQMKLGVQGIDYSGLMANPNLNSKFEGSMKKAIAAGSRDIREGDVAVELSGGSVVVKAGLNPTKGSPSSLVSDLQSSKDMVARQATQNIKSMPGRQAVTNGEISVKVLDISSNGGGGGGGGPPPAPARGGGRYGGGDAMMQKSAPPQDEGFSSPKSGSRPNDLLGSNPTSPQMEEFTSPQAASSMGSPQRGGRGSPTGKKGGKANKAAAAAAAPPPAKGSPDDIKSLLAQLQTQNVPRDVPSPKAPVERIVLDLPPQADVDFEKQLLKVSRLTDQKEKADLSGNLKDMSFQDPPAHIQGLAVRETLKEIGGKRREE